MKKVVVGCLVVGMVVAAQGAFKYWNGTGDLTRPWTDAANWNGGDLPVPGDGVVLRAFAKPLVVTDDDAALASSVNYFWSSSVSNSVCDDVIWNVSTNVDFRGVVGDWASANGARIGRFVKRGAGDFNIVPPATVGAGDYNGARWVVERGVFRYPQFETPPVSGWSVGEMTVSNGATVVVLAGTDANKTVVTTFKKLFCAGVVTNEQSTLVWVDCYSSSRPDDPSVVTGTIVGNIRFCPSGSVNLCGTNNTFSIARPRGLDGKTPQVIGVMSFGEPDGTPSSLGLDTQVNYDYNGPVFRYLGHGETLTKDAFVKLHDDFASWDAIHPVSFDGGPFGGLTLANKIYVGQTDGKLNNMIIEGTNATPCVYRATQRIFTATDGNYRPLHTIKRGGGTWDFPFQATLSLSSNNPYMIGGFSIEEGTIRAEEITDRGHPSSLGLGTDCYGEYMGPYDASKRVDWSISFGTTNADGVAEGEGTLEFYGPRRGYSSNRKMVLSGNGRIRNVSTNTLEMARVSARSAGEKTITLDGTNELDNVMSEISDGAGTVSVAKEGSGRWILRGNQTFSGDLRVREGTLEVQAPTNYFRYYRLTFLGMPSEFDGYVQPFKVAFFDKGGNNLSQSSYLPMPWNDWGNAQATGADGYHTLTREFLELPEPSGNATHGGVRCGYVMPGRAGQYKWSGWGQCFSYTWFTTSADSGYTTIPNFGANPVAGQEWTAFPVIVRLRSDLNPVAYYDLAASALAKRNPTAIRLEGSRDCVCWYKLDERSGLEYPGEKNWYSDKTAWAAGKRTVGNGAGYSITNNVAVSSLESVRSVQVAAGATLMTTATNVGKIKGLTIGATGIGTIDGFEFADTGTIDFEDVPARMSKPLTFHGTFRNDDGTSANFADWDFTVNGEVNTRRKMSYQDGTFTLVPSGLCIILR